MKKDVYKMKIEDMTSTNVARQLSVQVGIPRGTNFHRKKVEKKALKPLSKIDIKALQIGELQNMLRA